MWKVLRNSSQHLRPPEADPAVGKGQARQLHASRPIHIPRKPKTVALPDAASSGRVPAFGRSAASEELVLMQKIPTATPCGKRAHTVTAAGRWLCRQLAEGSPLLNDLG
jgi:hypothetical protein